MSVTRVYLIIPTFKAFDSKAMRANHKVFVDFLNDRIENLRKLNNVVSAYSHLDQPRHHGEHALKDNWPAFRNALLVKVYVSTAALTVAHHDFNENYVIHSKDITAYETSTAQFISANGEPIDLRAEVMDDEKLNNNSQLIFMRHEAAIRADIFRFIAVTCLPKDMVFAIIRYLDLSESVMTVMPKTHKQTAVIDGSLFTPVKCTEDNLKLLKRDEKQQEWLTAVSLAHGSVHAAVREPNLQVAYQHVTQAMNGLAFAVNESKAHNPARFFQGRPSAFQLASDLHHSLCIGFAMFLNQMPEPYQLTYMRKWIDEAMKMKIPLPLVDVILTYAFVTEKSPVAPNAAGNYDQLSMIKYV